MGLIRAGSSRDSEPEADSIQFGCSMLSRIRLQPRRSGSLAVIRCSLGYALHGDEDVAKCLAVEGPSSCWKAIPSWRVARLERMAPERAEPEPAGQAALFAGSNGSGEVEALVASVTLEVVVTEEVVECDPLGITKSDDTG
jgi:hypothetical protein